MGSPNTKVQSIFKTKDIVRASVRCHQRTTHKLAMTHVEARAGVEVCYCMETPISTKTLEEIYHPPFQCSPPPLPPSSFVPCVGGRHALYFSSGLGSTQQPHGLCLGHAYVMSPSQRRLDPAPARDARILIVRGTSMRRSYAAKKNGTTAAWNIHALSANAHKLAEKSL